ncbi:MAG: hypothetical protein PHS07_01170, partial [Patescibacteria group bacterium]|nr:hypothetical protein [Patescibacteria group bacterium]
MIQKYINMFLRQNLMNFRNKIIYIFYFIVFVLCLILQNSSPVLATSYSSIISEDSDLISFWRMDEESGSTFNDSENNHNAIISGGVTLGVESTYIVGDSSATATFDGTSGYASIGDVSVFNFTRDDPFTITAIIKPNVVRSGIATDYWIYTKMNPNSPYNGLMFGIRWDGNSTCLFFLFGADYPSQFIRLISSNDLLNGQEYLVGITYDGSGTSNGVTMYVDGRPVPTEDDPMSPTSQTIDLGEDTTASGYPAEIGRRYTINKWFKGNIKDVAIFDSEKTTTWMGLLAETAHPSNDLTSPVYTVNQSPRPQVIYDMDIDSDNDDVVDAVLMLNLERRGELDIVGAIITSANSKAAPTWLAIANYYGRSSIPTGVNTDAPGWSTSLYDSTIASDYGVPGKTDATDFESSVTIQRQLLASADDNSIEYITTGDLSSVKKLLESTSEDGYSELDGDELVAQKIRHLWIVGGNWPFGDGVSDFGSSSAKATVSNYVLTNWPTSIPIIFNSISDGNTVYTGENVMEALSADNPARVAWELYNGDDDPSNTRPGWAQIAILPLARGLLYHSITDVDYSRIAGYKGTASVNTSTGETSWDLFTDSNHSYLGKILSDEYYATAINELLLDLIDNIAPWATLDDDFLSWESGEVTVNYNLIDAEEDTCNLSQTATSGIEYSTDGFNWFDATDAGGDSEGLTNLSSLTTPGDDHVFVWDSATDLSTTEDSTVYLRIRPNDGELDADDWVTSSAFGIDNVAPSAVGVPSFGTITTSSIEINKPVSVTEDGSGLSQWQVRRSSLTELGFNVVATTSIEDTSLSENTQYAYDVQFKDTQNNLSSYGTSASKYTLVNIPTNLSATATSTTQIDLSVDSFPNDSSDSAGYYFINTTTSSSSGWIQTNTWQDTSLTCGTSYTYTIKYRNGDGTETETISTSQTTDECPDTAPSATLDDDFLSWESGEVTVNYNLIDAEEDTCNLSQTATSGIEYS